MTIISGCRPIGFPDYQSVWNLVFNLRFSRTNRFSMFFQGTKKIWPGEGLREKPKIWNRNQFAAIIIFFQNFQNFQSLKNLEFHWAIFLIFWQRHVWMQKRPFGKNSSDLITPAHCFFAKYCTIFQAKNVFKKTEFVLYHPRRWFGARPRNFCWGSYALS